MSEDALREKMASFAAKKPKGGRKVWAHPEITDFAFGRVLAFDQTYSNTGWACFRVDHEGLHVEDHGTLREPAIEIKGFEGAVQRAIWMGARIEVVMQTYWQRATHVVCERTPVLGHQLESSLLGMYGVWQATLNYTTLGKPALVANDHMRFVMNPPDQRYEKKHVGTALNRFIDTTRGWNEHNRDALALGLTYLYDRKKEQQ